MSISNELQKLQDNMANAYAACAGKNATMPEARTMANLAPTIDSITQGDIPKGVAIDGVKWTEEWATKGLNGTIVDIVVGDDLCPRLEITVTVRKPSTTQQVVIDWGDGTTTTTTGTSTSAVAYNHTYSQAGHYVLTVDDKANLVSFGSTSWSTAVPTDTTVGRNNTRLALRRVRQFGTSLTSLDSFAASCLYCNSAEGGFEDELPPLPPNLTTINYAFYYLRFYRGHIPYLNHLTKCTIVQYAFYLCIRMIGTLQILPPNTTNANYTFQDCHSIEVIPYDVFPLSLSNSLTQAISIFNSVGYRLDGPRMAFPKIDHLTKMTTCQYMFTNCKLCEGELPKLPSGNVLKSCQYMFQNISTKLIIHADYFDNTTGITSLAYTFNGCYNLNGEMPRIPATVTSMSNTFNGCNHLGGTFTPIPAGCTSLYSTYLNCWAVKGQLPDLPSVATDFRSCFSGCRSATGKFPDLGHISNLASGDYCSSMFAYCRQVSQPPNTWFNSTIKAKITSLVSMFGYCDSLESFPFELDDLPACTIVSSMFRDCYNLEQAPTRLPPNVTSTSYTFYYCPKLKSPAVHIGQYQKLTNISYMYQYDMNLSPMVDEDGNLEMRKEEYYSGKNSTRTQAFQCASLDVQRQFWDAAVAAGATGGGGYFAGTCPNYNYCLYYKGGIS